MSNSIILSSGADAVAPAAPLVVTATPELSEYTLAACRVPFVLSVLAPRDVAAVARAPVDIVLAIDVSMSMLGTLPLVKRTAQYIVKCAAPEDRIGVLSFSAAAAVVFAAEPMTPAAKLRAHAAIEMLETQSDTNIADALIVGAQMIGALLASDGAGPAHGTPPFVLHLDERVRLTTLLLLTDGEPTTGTKTKSGLDALAGAFPAACSLHTFGYGEDHDADIIQSIAKIRGGTYYFIKSDEEVAAAFGDCIGGLLSTVAQNIRLTIKPPSKQSVLTGNFGAYAQTTGADGSITVMMGDLQSEERRDFLMYIDIAAALPCASLPLVQYRASYFSVADVRMVDTLPTTLCVTRADTATSKNPAPIVSEQVNRGRFVKATLRAKALADKGNLSGARTLMDAAIAKMTQSNTRTTAYTLELIAGLMKIKAGFADRNTYIDKGARSLASIAAVHATQRSAGQAQGSAMYSTSYKMQSQFEYEHELASSAAIPDDQGDALGSDDDDDADDDDDRDNGLTQKRPHKRARLDNDDGNDDASQQSQMF